MEPTPDFRPLYLQLKELFIKRLARNAWGPGELLPSEPKLAAQFGVSQGTVRKALDEMAAQNLVVRRQGKGTFVATHNPDRALFHFFLLVGEDGGRQLPDSRVVSRKEGLASREERRHLELEPRARVWRIKRVRSLNGIPAILERIAVPAALFPRLGETPVKELPNTLYEYYEREYGIVIAHAVERLRAVSADANDAKSLTLATGAPLLQVNRVALGHEQQPIEWRVSRCDTRHHYYLNKLD